MHTNGYAAGQPGQLNGKAANHHHSDFMPTPINGHMNGHSMSASEERVLIVGGGPSGLLLAYILARMKIPSVVIERHLTRLGAPKAHALSARTLEICRQFGLSVPEIRSYGSPRAHGRHVRFVTNLTGLEIGSLPYERMDLDLLNFAPEILHNIPQPDFENFIAGYLAKEPLCEIRRGVTWLSCEEKTVKGKTLVYSSVKSTSTNEDLGTIPSRFLVACDGAKSRVRLSLGIDMSGEDAIETLLTIHFNADLKSIVEDRVAILYWIMDPAARGFIIGYNLGGQKPGNQVLIHSVDNEKRNVKDYTDEECRKIVTTAIGKELPFEILSKTPWVLSRKVADRYRVGKVFLAGDAAHAFPPTGGLGLNTGVADVHNLALKLAAVWSGQASEEILERYELERRQVAVVNAAQSLKNGKKIFALLREIDTETTSMESAREEMMAHLTDPKFKSRIDSLIEDQREHFNNLNLHLGYIYGDDQIPANASDYTPTFLPGAILPHAWIVPCSNQLCLPKPVDMKYLTDAPPDFSTPRQYSILDLVQLDGLTLVTSSSSEMDRVADAVHKEVASIGAVLAHRQMGRDFTLSEEAGLESSQAWMSASGLKDGHALLIRPDQHILGKFTPDTAKVDLVSTVRHYYGVA